MKTETQSEDLTWYALRVKSQTERRSSQILRKLGYMTQVPVKTEYRKANRFQKRKVEKRYPLMWGYVLIAFDGSPDWWGVLNKAFVKGVVGCQGRPLKLSRTQVERLLSKEQRGEFQAPEVRAQMRSRHEFAVGDMVRFDHGGFEGYEGKVVEITQSSARVLLKFLGAERALLVPLDAAIKAA